MNSRTTVSPTTANLGTFAHSAPDCLGYDLRTIARTEAEDPIRQFWVRRLDPPAVDLQEGQHGDKGRTLVAVDELLAFGDPVRQDGRLERQIGVLLVRVRFGSCERTLQAGPVTQLVSRLRCRSADDQPMQLKDVSQRQVDRLHPTGPLLSHLVLLPWSFRVVIGKDL